jgi:hypothetical protein
VAARGSFYAATTIFGATVAKADLQRLDRMNPLRANHHRVVAATTLLASVGVRKLGHWPLLPALVVIPLMLALDLAFLSANLLELFQGGGVHLGETKPMAGAAVPHSARPLLSQLDQDRSGVAAGSSGLLAAQALDPRYPPGVGEPHLDGYLRGVYLPVQPPPRTEPRGSSVSPRRPYSDPSGNRRPPVSEGKPDSPLPPDGHGDHTTTFSS